MELEKKRGISISSTVLQFAYGGYNINLLDTPGHKDFSEDTYRVLTAVDAVVMVIDAAKGIETQTRKLFEVCRRRDIPIFTFINKLDRPGREPLALLDELEKVLGIGAFPVNWPLGMGSDFKGVYDRLTKQVHLFERTVGGASRAPVSISDLNDPVITERMDPVAQARLVEDLAMLDLAGETFDDEAVLAAKITPVFFGSAANNFGVQLLLDGFVRHSAPPRARASNGGLIPPERETFSGFIFKIQANMDPRHRDRVAFLRICSGHFVRDMSVIHVRTGKKVRLSNSAKLFAQERETVDEAYAGDILGLVGYQDFGIGDTLSEDPLIEFDEIPKFPPECFAYLHGVNTAKFKQFRQGLAQLLQEGVIQVFHLADSAVKVPLLAAVGPLQFEVVQYRLQSEYGAESRLESAAWTLARWLPVGMTTEALEALNLPSGARLAFDNANQPLVLFPNEWSARYFGDTNKSITLSELAGNRPVAQAALD
jgi:peptide chain release factor 3